MGLTPSSATTSSSSSSDDDEKGVPTTIRSSTTLDETIDQSNKSRIILMSTGKETAKDIENVNSQRHLNPLMNIQRRRSRRNTRISAITLDEAIVPKTDWQKEIYLLWSLAWPTIAIQLGMYLPNFLIASQVGRWYGSIYLGGFTLANMMGNLCNLSLLQGLYTAADTLGPQAFCAGNYSQVGLLAIRGFVASAIVLIPINIILIMSFRLILVSVGEDHIAAQHAQEYYRIFVLGLPFYVLYNITWKFLSAQEIMRPLVVVCVICCICILPIGAFGFLRESWLGFSGSAWTIVLFQFSQAVLLLLYVVIRHPHRVGTWPGLSTTTIRQALLEPKAAFAAYFCLGIGGMLATSEWIYWETLTLLIGTMGVVPLSVHTIPTQVLMIGFMLPYGIGIALAVRLGATLPLSVFRAKRLTLGTFVASTVLFGAMSVLLYIFKDLIFATFTHENAVIVSANDIWHKVCVYYFNLSIYALSMGIATGLGKQWMFGIVTVIFLWGLSLPSMYYLCIVKGGGLSTAWACITLPYIAMNTFFIYRYFLSLDWEDIQSSIRSREGMNDEMYSSLTMANGCKSQNVDPNKKPYGTDAEVSEKTGLLLTVNGGRTL